MINLSKGFTKSVPL